LIRKGVRDVFEGAAGMVLYPLYERRLVKEISKIRKPAHIAIMCDGNRRWARAAGFTDVASGHRAGALKIVEALGWCGEFEEVETVTLYLLSAENLGRDAEELEELLEIIGDVVDEIAAPGHDWHIHLMGHMDLLPKWLVARLKAAEVRTSHRDGLTINVAIGYGGRQEIVDAVQALLDDKIAEGATQAELRDAVTIPAIGEHLYTSGQPDPDLVIRTSGEQRLSGFLLWQTAYSEIWFTDAYWPEFRRVDFLRALRDFASRDRRYGK